MIWRLDSFRLCLGVWGPKLGPNVKIFDSIHWRTSPGGLSLRRIVVPWRSYVLWDIFWCQIYWQTRPLVLNPIDPVFWLSGRCNERPELDICLDGRRRTPMWRIDRFIFSFGFGRSSLVSLGLPSDLWLVDLCYYIISSRRERKPYQCICLRRTCVLWRLFALFVHILRNAGLWFEWA